MPLSYRRRIQIALLALGTLPTAVAVIGWALAVQPSSGRAARTQQAIDSLARTGRALVETVDSTRLAPSEQQALGAHTRALNDALSTLKRQETISTAVSATLATIILALGALVLYASVRVGGFLSRQLSRPIDELVGWAALVRDQQPLPAHERESGAPEFAALRRALREMAAGLSEARARQFEAERLRAFREVARRVAHEMRNPLTPIRFAVSALSRTAQPEQKESLEVLQAEADRLEQLAREFTEMGRLPEGPAAEVDLGELLSELVRTALPPAVVARLELDPATPRITGYYEPLRRAFSNLLRNAVEAGAGPGGLVVRCRPMDANGAEVRIIDRGRGVSADLRDRLFTPYVTGGKEDGTGLGLALVRHTIESHGGAVHYEPTPGGGATFVVSLPSVAHPQ